VVPITISVLDSDPCCITVSNYYVVTVILEEASLKMGTDPVLET
jgi:hypothetical protein